MDKSKEICCKFSKKENYQGGILAIAKNLSQFCKKIDVYSSGSFSPNELNNIKSIEKNLRTLTLL